MDPIKNYDSTKFELDSYLKNLLHTFETPQQENVLNEQLKLFLDKYESTRRNFEWMEENSEIIFRNFLGPLLTENYQALDPYLLLEMILFYASISLFMILLKI